MTQKKLKQLENNVFKVCNSLNYDFIKLLNNKVLTHSNISSEIFIDIIQELSDEKISNITELAHLIGFNVKIEKIENNQFLFEIKYIDNKLLLRISNNSSESEHTLIFATALADILCNYTSGMNENLYSAYVKFSKNTNKVNVFHHPSLTTADNQIKDALSKIITPTFSYTKIA